MTTRQALTPAPVGACAPALSSLDRALRLLEHMATMDENGASLAELAADLGVNKSTLHHTLATLRGRRWVEQDQDGRYLLGPATRQLTRWWTRSDRLISQVHPTLARVSLETNELVHLGRLSEHSILYLDKVEPERAIRVRSSVGRLVPAASTALGRAILAASGWPESQLGTWLDAVEDPRPGLAESFRRNVRLARELGYATELEENEAGIGCVSVALSVLGVPQLAISISVPIERLNSERIPELANTIMEAVENADLTEVSIARVSALSPLPA